jgi:predicted MPP superfamily phosphohydrolase
MRCFVAHLEIGARKRLRIRTVNLTFPGVEHETTVLYASDLHLWRWSPHIGYQLVDAVNAAQPDVLLLGGDLVDDKSGLPLLADCIGQLVRYCPVWAVSGNHDSYVGIPAVRECIEAAGGHWLDETSFWLNNIRIDGYCRPCEDESAILCTHDPAVFPQAIENGYSLVLAGHLHGSQCVFLEREHRLYPGAWFFRWNGDEFHRGDTTMLVSRGANDTLPIRWNCPREVILCNIKPSHP